MSVASTSESLNSRVVVHRPKNDDDNLTSILVKAGAEFLGGALLVWLSFYLGKTLISIADTSATKQLNMKKTLARRLKRPEIETMAFNSYEARIAGDVICCDEVDTNFDDIGGMESELEDVRDMIILPMQLWKTMKDKSGICSCPTGVLLYGRPGTGKAMTAKAKESGATFISIKSSSIIDKWVGESDKLAAALFSLSKKLAPNIIFIDEIDTLLRSRSGPHDSNSVIGTVQAPVVVLGATNRPMDLDKAFLRRMPVSIRTPDPDANARTAILRKLLAKVKVADDVELSRIAYLTDNFTGSDLRELVRVAMTQSAKRHMQTLKKHMDDASAAGNAGANNPLLPPLSIEDFSHALNKTTRPVSAASSFAERSAAEDGESDSDPKALAAMFLRALNVGAARGLAAAPVFRAGIAPSV